MSAKLKVGVLISGRGSNLQALIDGSRRPGYPAEIVLVVSNVPEAQGLERAKAASIPIAVVDHRKYASREAFDEALDERLRKAGVQFICLAGFMRILSAAFVRTWEGRMINIHPSLLPDFKGTDVHERVIAAGVEKSGCTVHYVTPELDSGPNIGQSETPVAPGDVPQALAQRVLDFEHELYPEALGLVAEKEVRLENGRAVFEASFMARPDPRHFSSLDDQLRFAITNRRLIELMYAGSARVVEPHDYGVQKGKERLLVYQQRGPSGLGWRLLDIAKIDACSVLVETFAGSRGAAHRQHYTWDTLYARVT